MDEEKQFSRDALGEISATRHRTHHNWDKLSTGSFIGAAIFGAYNIGNSIRTKFYHSFVEGYNESRTPFSDILEEYNGKSGMPDTSSSVTDGKYDALALRHNNGEINGAAYTAQRKALTHEFRGKINQRLLEEFEIPSKGLKGWTVGSVKRWEQLGSHARRDAGLGFATVVAIGLGAVGLLRHNKHVLDNVDNKMDELQDQMQQQNSR